jgi:hypothetical protein
MSIEKCDDNQNDWEQSINFIDQSVNEPVPQGKQYAARVAALNDRLRREGRDGSVMLTRSVAALAPETRRAIVDAVRSFDDFGPRNDPYGEHDCAVVEVEGLSILWKIDAYDLSMTMGSPDPLDPAVTRRVLTIMLAEDY